MSTRSSHDGRRCGVQTREARRERRWRDDLVRTVDIDQSGVSRHLRILGEAGFVNMRPDGARRLYSLRPEPFQEVRATFSAFMATRFRWQPRRSSQLQ
jgi:DNA-binding transcriptional ArsR family regulator